jgi:parvulin-like peptidyl-prolyl isomerase
MSLPRRSAARLRAERAVLLAALGALAATSCTAVATTPSWTGGGLAISAPTRTAEEDAAEVRERERRSSEPEQVGARHILVMHDGSQRKPEGVTRTREAARQRAQECLVKIRGGADFDAVVRECSDEPGAAERSGDVGVFERASMVKSFADAAFALKVGQVSEVVESPFGFHIIKRTE